MSAPTAERSTEAAADVAPVPGEDQVSGPAAREKAPKAPRAPRTPRTPAPGASVVSSATTMVLLVCAWSLLQLLVLGGLSHDRDQDLLYDRFRTELAALTAPVGPVVPAGDPVALVSVPAAGVSEVVVEGTASGDLIAGPGHRRDTPLPGQEGISLVYGRAATFGGPFRSLTDVSIGDQVKVTTAQGVQDLAVTGVRRDGDPLPAPPEPGTARVTFVTAEGSGRLAALTANETVYVDAETTEAHPVPGGRPTVAPDSEAAMAPDPGALPLLALWLALLVGLTLAVVLARQRWSAALVWVVASPVALALAWQTTETAARLLPNLV